LNSNMMAPSGSDFTLLPLRRVMDLVAQITYAQLVLELNDDLRVNRGGPSAGKILEQDALKIESAVNAVLAELVVKPGHAVDAQLIVSRTDNLLSSHTLNSETIVVPLAIIKTINNVLRFVNPALEASVV
jgi:hypothetical protein